jgi:glycosyltransferase involved in cell wall biosynthesis
VVHTHSGVWYKVSLAARRAGVRRLVHTDHGRITPDPLSYRIADHFASRRTDAIVAVSDALRERMLREVVAPGCSIAVIPNGIDTREFSPPPSPTSDWRNRHGVAADQPLVVTVGRLDPVKCYDLMLRAFRDALDATRSGPRPLLVIAGDGPDEARLKSIAGELRLGDAVKWLGWSDDVRDLLSEAAVFTLSSRSEGTSMSLLEAMSCGVCPVVTDVGGNAAVLGPRLAHRLVPSGDAGALAAGYRRALEQVDERRRDGSEARRRVENAFSLDAMVSAYMRLYTGAAA